MRERADRGGPGVRAGVGAAAGVDAVHVAVRLVEGEADPAGVRVQRDKKQAEASFLKKTADEEDEDDDEDDDDNDLSSKNPLSGDGRRPPPLAGGLGKGGESLADET